MAVVEYMMHRINGSNAAKPPDWVGDRGHWHRHSDKTYVGWIDDDREYFVPDTVVTLTKAEFVTRAQAMHTENPLKKPLFDADGNEMWDGATRLQEDKTMDEVTAEAEAWYDDFVLRNS